MSHNIEDMIEDIKKPVLDIKLIKQEDSSPNLESHFGGKPYISMKDDYPSCCNCREPLTFVFQLHIPQNPEKTSTTLYAIYYCFACEEDYGKEGFEVLQYNNPTEADMSTTVRVQKTFPYCQLHFSPDWSLPDWEYMQDYTPRMPEALQTAYGDECFNVYDTIREQKSNFKPFHPASFYKGYSQFAMGYELVSCDVCKKNLEQWVQFSSYEQVDLSWGEHGTMHIFRCPDHPEEFKFIIQ